METRTVIEKKLFILVLNPMQGNTKNAVPCAASYEKQKLIDWYNSQSVNAYQEEGGPSFACHGDSHTWHKSFRPGSSLEWFNPCDIFDKPNNYGQGIQEQWVREDFVLRSDIPLIH